MSCLVQSIGWRRHHRENKNRLLGCNTGKNVTRSRTDEHQSCTKRKSWGSKESDLYDMKAKIEAGLWWKNHDASGEETRKKNKRAAVVRPIKEMLFFLVSEKKKQKKVRDGDWKGKTF